MARKVDRRARRRAGSARAVEGRLAIAAFGPRGGRTRPAGAGPPAPFQVACQGTMAAPGATWTEQRPPGTRMTKAPSWWTLDVRGLALRVWELGADGPASPFSGTARPIICLHAWLDQGLAFAPMAAGRAAWIAGARVETIDGGHMLPYDAPGPLGDLVQAFLDEAPD